MTRTLLVLWEVVRWSIWLRNRRIDEILLRLPKLVRTDVPSADIAELVSAISKVFLFDISGNKCLAFSYILCRQARRAGIDARLIIGVRTRPFFSHAWVEVNRQVVNDDPDLRKKLSVILEA
ncbi:lasso peptide biosynthesis B2 protein [Pelagibacterium halotolerans]|uniref:lasso peptide biosynthesis B2 protein n=1 Tax=Pelagibacterium halotolerans TaxID=531813 RepID=UPI00384AC8C6